MSLFRTVPRYVKLALALTLAGAVAGVVAWGAQTRASGPAVQVTATAAPDVPAPVTEVGEAPPRPTPFVSPNYIAPDQAALDEVAMDQVALAETEQRCPPTWLLYESQLLDGSFCYPPTWKLVFGDRPILPPEERPDGYTAALLLVKYDSSAGQELARAVIQITGTPRSEALDCPEPGALQAGPQLAKVCFQERKVDNYNSLPGDVARVIIVAFPVTLPDSGLPEVPAGVQLVDQTPGQTTARFSREDQREGLGIITSIRFNKP